MDSTVSTSDAPPVVMGVMPQDWVQAMGPKLLRPGRLLKFSVREVGVRWVSPRGGCAVGQYKRWVCGGWVLVCLKRCKEANLPGHAWQEADLHGSGGCAVGQSERWGCDGSVQEVDLQWVRTRGGCAVGQSKRWVCGGSVQEVGVWWVSPRGGCAVDGC
jgi:hypothetical protein